MTLDYFTEVKKYNNESLGEKGQQQKDDINLKDIQDSLLKINETAQNIIKITEDLNNRVDEVMKEVRQLSSKNIFSIIFHTRSKIRNNEEIRRYYLFGICIFKKKMFNYDSNIGNISYKYVHILHKNIITSDIVKLLNNYFDSTEHVFIFNSGGDEKNLEMLRAKNILYGDIGTLRLDIDKLKKVIVYGLFSSRLSEFLYENPDILSKTYWAIMGGDLYSYPDNTIENYVRQNIAGIITTFDKYDYYKRFGCKPTYDIVYNNPVAKYIEKAVEHKLNKPYKIMINNSTDETTLEMLDTLSKFKDENIIITTNLSYVTYGQNNVKEQIMEKGKKIFGDKFKPVLKWKTPKKYVSFLSSIDVYISNQNRQQGVGNMSAFMLLGKKVYIKPTVSTYEGFTNMGIKIFDVSKIKNSSFKTFLDMKEEDIENNIAVLRKRLSLEYQVSLWSKVFND